MKISKPTRIKIFYTKYLFAMYLISILFLVNTLNGYSQQTENIFNHNYIDILYGVAYEPEDHNAINHPFFLDDKIYKANLWFEGNKITDVFLKYDLYKQILVLYQNYNINKFRFIQINSDGVQKVELFDNDNQVHYLIPCWQYPDIFDKIVFYEKIYSNRITFLVGRIKVLDELASGSKNKFSENQKSYFIIENKPYEVRNKKDILTLFGDHKKEIKSFIKKNKLTIKLTNTKDIVDLISYYESLTKNNSN